MNPHPTHLEVARALDSGRTAIIAEWESRAREAGAPPALRAFVPGLLASLSEALRTGKQNTSISPPPGLALPAALREFRHLRAVLTKFLGRETPLPAETQIFLHEFLDHALETAARTTAASPAPSANLGRDELLARFTRDSAWDADLCNGTIWWNEKLLRHFGYEPPLPSARPRWWLSRIHPDDRPRFRRELKQALAGPGAVWTGEFRFRRFDGAYADVLASAQVVRNEAGEPARLVGLVRDISFQKTQARLREHAEFVRDTLFNMPGLLFSISGGDGIYQELSHAWSELLGYSSEELCEKPFVDFVHPDDRERTREETKRLLAGGIIDNFLNRYRAKNGRYHWLQWTTQLRDGTFYSFCSDVTGIKETENKLRASQDRFNRVSEATGLGVWYCDLPFDELNWNKEVKEHFFLPLDYRVTIDTFYERIHPEDRELTRRAIAESIRSGERYDIQYRTTNPADPQDFRWIRAVGWTSYGPDDSPVSFDGFTLDITDSKRTEAELVKSQTAIIENEQLLKLITDRLPTFVAYVDRDLTYRFLNEAYRRCFGPDVRPGIAMRDVVSPEVFAKAEPQARRALAGEAIHYENTVITFQGERMVVDAEYLPDFHPHTGEVRGYVVVGHDITARKQAAHALEESEFRLRLALKASRIGIFEYIVGKDEIVLDGQLAHDWGLPPGTRQSIGRVTETLVHPEDRARVTEHLRAALENRAPYDLEIRIVRQDTGEVRWVHTRAEVSFNAAGQAERLTGTAVDVTDRAEADQALKERSELFRLITDTIPHGVWRTNPDGSADYFSQRFVEIVGHSLDELLGWGWAEVIHPEDRPRVLKAWQEGRDNQAPVAAEFRVKSAEGRYRWFISQGNPFFDARGNLIKYYGTWTDIEERKTHAGQLQRLAETSLLLNSTSSLNEKLAALTQQAREILGAHQAALRLEPLVAGGEAINAISFSAKYRDTKASLLDPAETGLYHFFSRLNRPVSFTRAEIEANPGYREALGKQTAPRHGFLAAPLVNARGESIGVILIADKYEGDFTENDEGIFAQLAQIASGAIENALLLEREQAAVVARDEFLSIASHELKTPLTSIKLQSQIFQRMVRKGDPRAYQADRLNSVMDQTNRQVNRLTRLVDDMLDISRIRTGKLSIELQAAPFGDLVREAVERMNPHFRAEEVPAPVLKIHANPVLPLDPVRMEQVVNNLLTNALRYGKRRPVTVCLEERGAVTRLTVKDNGMGIEPQNIDKIFDRFERAVSANEVSGLGLGLYISRQIVKAHGGEIWAESEPGRGSTFFVELPLAPLA